MNIAVILAGGTGSRMNIDIPKQFLKINDIPIIAYTLKTFELSGFIDKIVIVSLKQYYDKINEIIKSYNINKFYTVVENGSTRQKSIYNALNFLKNSLKEDDIVLIHDGVRAMINEQTINKCIIETQKYNSTTLAEKTKNTMVIAENNHQIKNFLDREYIYNIQTPQSFRFGIIYQSHIQAIKNGYENITDDTQIAMLNNYKVQIIENEYPNLKLTTKQDIAIFEYYLNKEKK